MSIFRVILVCFGVDQSLSWQLDQPLRGRKLWRARESIAAESPSRNLRGGPVLLSCLRGCIVGMAFWIVLSLNGGLIISNKDSTLSRNVYLHVRKRL